MLRPCSRRTVRTARRQGAQVVIGYLNQFHCCGAPARAEGVAMGFAICRGIVEGLGDTIRVETTSAGRGDLRGRPAYYRSSRRRRP
jgi:hypothetical protein